MKPVLHIYPQEVSGDDVSIIGNKKGLMVLYKTLKKVLKKGTLNESAKVYTADGGAFEIKIMETEKIEETAIPYTDDFKKEKAGIQPWQLWERSRFL